MRKENESYLKSLEQQYMKKKENSGVGRQIRQKMGWKKEGEDEEDDDFSQEEREIEEDIASDIEN